MKKPFALTIVAAMAVGCGSSDDGPSKADFVKKADAVCAKGDKQIDAAASRTFTGKKVPNQAVLTRFIKAESLPAVRKQIDDIKKLEPPKGDEDKVKAITDGVDDALAKTEAQPQLAIAGGAKNPFTGPNKLARDYGLKRCGAESN